MQKITRRQLLAGFITTAAAGQAKMLNAAPGSQRVLVVGAGLAGLYAARMLEQLGYSVQVVEGRDRVGGRIYTLDNVPGRPEAGGNGMGASYGRILDSAERLNVPMRRQLRGLPSDYIVDGTHLTAKQWSTWEGNTLPKELRNLTPERIYGHFLKKPPFVTAADWRSPTYAEYDISAAEHFRSLGLDEKTISLIDINNSYGNTLADTSVLSLYRVRATINRAIAMRKPGYEVSTGNMRLPEAMANSLVNPVILKQKIVEVKQSSSGIKAISQSGASYEADALIMALPVTAVRNIRITPMLAKEQDEAFKAIEYHKITQAHFISKQPFWESQGHKGSYWTNGPLGRIFSRKIPDTDLFNMTVWINGDECDVYDRLPEPLAKEKITEEFFKTCPGANSSNVELKQLVRWQNEPLNQGVWPVWKPGQITQLFNLLHQPSGRLFFAGEHTGYAYSGMEAAAESGERAALEVARSLS